MNKYQDKLSGFAERMKTEENLTPIQEVNPISKESSKLPKKEIQLNIWIPISLMKMIKQKSLDKDKTIKEFVTDAVISFINKNP